ncbi:MFS transporter [Microtetraspora malaysiensis]|uniref:MFS transporter n=1 Tax=Microtetraspora malaysiensis TaxID=161358 RepID=UPI003D916058
MLQALRVRDFRLLWTARSIATLGTGLLDVAVPAHVYAVTGSALATGLSLAFRYLPALLLGPFAGVIADRWDRRRIMITTDLMHTMAISVVLLAETPESIWLIYVASIGQGTAAVIFRPAAQAHTPTVVGVGPLLTSANALGAFTTGVVGLSAPPIGGLLFATSGINTVIGAAIAASLLSATAIARTTTRSRAHGPAHNVLTDLIKGLRHLRQAAATRALLAANSAYLLANAALTALLIPFGVTRLGESVQVGYLLSALGLGFLLGAPISRRLVDHFTPRTIIALSQSLVAGAFFLMFNAASLPVALTAAVLLGVPGVTVLVAIQTWLQRATPKELLGRVSSAFVTVEAAASMAGAFAGPTLSELISLPLALNAACAVTLLSALLTLCLMPRGDHPPAAVAAPADADHQHPSQLA